MDGSWIFTRLHIYTTKNIHSISYILFSLSNNNNNINKLWLSMEITINWRFLNTYNIIDTKLKYKVIGNSWIAPKEIKNSYRDITNPNSNM